MKTLKKLAALAFMALPVTMLTSCDSDAENAVENAANNVENAVEDVGNSLNGG